ncbi:hypothetical protein OG478_03920 [Streptomyces phaeochromogenes]|uniref:hypothetical protein n=1 Tax=Streptomyces phaeochromogenes TaxID=1923 RepID=UPI003869AE74|nr:hypothetical protein OG478_03920 [Streptomyces phaeochromogenes]
MREKSRLAVMTLLSLVVLPISVPFASHSFGTEWVAVVVFLAIASGGMALAISHFWDYGSCPTPREFLTAVPGLTASALLMSAPWLAPWALHDLAGQPALARVIEAEPAIDSKEEDTGRTHYRLADAATERDLGWMRFGPPTRAPAGAVIPVSVIPNGWSPPIATERLNDPDADPLVTTFAALVTAHVFACATAAAAWPREDQS